jgi:hypothetical protein
MTRETTNGQVQELYPESDAATRRELEWLANSISRYREAMHHAAEQQTEPMQLERAQQRRRSTQRRVMLEWAVAVVLCVVALVPAMGYYRHHEAQLQAQRQEEQLQQRAADAALLEQVASEVSETVPDSLQPLADMDTEYAGYETSVKETEKENGAN